MRQLRLQPRIQDPHYRRLLVAMIVLGYGLRWLAMPFASHTDVLLMPWLSGILLHGHFNVYEALFAKFGDASVTGTAIAPNFPGYYVFSAAWLWVLQTLGLANVPDWTETIVPTHGYSSAWTAVTQAARQFGVPHARTVFLLKLPYLPLDLAVGYMLYLVAGPRTGLIAWAAWALNPLAVYTPFLMGQADMLPTFLVVLSLYAGWRSFVTENPAGERAWSLGAALALGVGASVKAFPLFLLPVAAIVLGRGRIGRTLLLLGAGAAAFGLIVAPYMRSTAFVQSALLNREGLRLFELSFDPLNAVLRSGPMRPVVDAPFLVLYGGVLIWAAIGQKKFDRLWRAYALSLLCLLVGSTNPPYWHIWLAPLVALSVAVDLRAALFACAQSVYVFVHMAFFNRDLLLSLLAATSQEFSFGLAIEDRIWNMFNELDIARFAVLFVDSLFVVASLSFAAWLVMRRQRLSEAEALATPVRSSTLAAALCAPLVLVALMPVGEFLVSRHTVVRAVSPRAHLVASSDSALEQIEVGPWDRTPSALAGVFIGPPYTDIHATMALRTSGAEALNYEITRSVRLDTDGTDFVEFWFPPEAFSKQDTYEVELRGAPPDRVNIGVTTAQDSVTGSASEVQVSPVVVSLYTFDWRRALHDLLDTVQEDRAFFALWSAVVPLGLLAALLRPRLASGVSVHRGQRVAAADGDRSADLPHSETLWRH